VQPRGDKLAVVTQTTLSVDDAPRSCRRGQARFPHVREPKKQDICYATQNRQDAVKLLAPQVDVVIVVGSPTSSNSNRLRELAERLGTAGLHGRHAPTTCRPSGSKAAAAWA
jgi:4-hydroxy-3-methylbut-2-en-1-yl diphosphate reductase